MKSVEMISNESSHLNDKLKNFSERLVMSENTKQGLLNVRASLFLVLWYVFSGCTLFLNKYILTYMNGDPTLLGTFQMLTTTVCGFIQLYFPCGMYKPTTRLGKPPGFFRHMIFVGCTRFATVILGLVALNFVAVSFTETIKSSAPLFTVLISRFLLGENTGLYVNLSLIPVMSGLALCSANELSFNLKGFIAAMLTNLTECLQNVYSKMLISGEKFKYTPAELQFYTSISSVFVQIPITLLFVDSSRLRQTNDHALLIAFIINGVFFHFQSISAYVLMDYISPVTHSCWHPQWREVVSLSSQHNTDHFKVTDIMNEIFSFLNLRNHFSPLRMPTAGKVGETFGISGVANTAKRAFLIWFSIILFNNPVTVLSGLGTAIVIVGVLLYNKAQEFDKNSRSKTLRL